MKISHGTRFKNPSNHNGYGYATERMLTSLKELGYQVSSNDASADVEIWFDQPQNWKFSDGPYKIGYHPWESTQLQDGWVEIMNRCDEIWTPSPLIADWYVEAGIEVPIYVYEHGVDHVWEPRVRRNTGPIHFLHVGAEASRKGGWDTMRCFNAAFPHDRDVRLTLKTINQTWLGIKDFNRIKFLNKKMDFASLQNLFYNNHVYVYPSWGEGFGLTPLQAMATGMPTITVPAWAPYHKFIDPKLSLSAELVPSPWPKIHPGDMFQPNFDELVDLMREAKNNYSDHADFAMRQAKNIHQVYDWNTLTFKAFSDLEARLNS